ncbi:MAG TPA: class I SAM-dependent methyltransferase [Sporichthyaceae bacterium]|jgi:SAM-dependent methyltransferase
MTEVGWAAPPTDADFARLRAPYLAELAEGWQRFLQPAATACPWCGSTKLAVRTRLPDLVQRKPGRFRFDVCRTCGHVFQNPRLSPEGLAFYYRDFYDGLGASTTQAVFAQQTEIYRSRARAVAPFLTPRQWLDVGCGHGHFAKDAQSIWPQTAFDGLDFGDGAQEAARRGWLRTAHRGEFAELAGDLTGRYDVISMFHYLEHLSDPRAELAVAARALAPDGYLYLELPDPTFLLGRALGPMWTPGHTLQHLHLMPLPNLLTALDAAGFVPVNVERGSAHIPIDLTSAAMALGTLLGPDPRLPWRPRSTKSAVRRHRTVWRAAPPVIKAAYATDRKLAPLFAAAGVGNVYRVLARRAVPADRIGPQNRSSTA